VLDSSSEREKHSRPIDDGRAHERRHGDVREACERACDGADAWKDAWCVPGKASETKTAAEPNEIRRRTRKKRAHTQLVVLCRMASDAARCAEGRRWEDNQRARFGGKRDESDAKRTRG